MENQPQPQSQASSADQDVLTSLQVHWKLVVIAVLTVLVVILFVVIGYQNMTLSTYDSTGAKKAEHFTIDITNPFTKENMLQLNIKNPFKKEHLDLIGLPSAQLAVAQQAIRADPYVTTRRTVQRNAEHLKDTVGLNAVQLSAFQQAMASDPIASRETMIDTVGLPELEKVAVARSVQMDPYSSSQAREYIQNKSEVPLLVSKLY
jgi:hypothetical protein